MTTRSPLFLIVLLTTVAAPPTNAMQAPRALPQNKKRKREAEETSTTSPLSQPPQPTQQTHAARRDDPFTLTPAQWQAFSKAIPFLASGTAQEEHKEIVEAVLNVLSLERPFQNNIRRSQLNIQWNIHISDPKQCERISKAFRRWDQDYNLWEEVSLIIQKNQLPLLPDEPLFPKKNGTTR